MFWWIFVYGKYRLCFLIFVICYLAWARHQVLKSYLIVLTPYVTDNLFKVLVFKLLDLRLAYNFCSLAFLCRHIVVILHMWCPLISTQRKMTFSVRVMITMRFATGILINVPALMLLRSLATLTWFNYHRSVFDLSSLPNLIKLIKAGRIYPCKVSTKDWTPSGCSIWQCCVSLWCWDWQEDAHITGIDKETKLQEI